MHHEIPRKRLLTVICQACSAQHMTRKTSLGPFCGQRKARGRKAHLPTPTERGMCSFGEAAVVQLAEREPSKLDVAGSKPARRSSFWPMRAVPRICLEGFSSLGWIDPCGAHGASFTSHSRPRSSRANNSKSDAAQRMQRAMVCETRTAAH